MAQRRDQPHIAPQQRGHHKMGGFTDALAAKRLRTKPLRHVQPRDDADEATLMKRDDDPVHVSVEVAIAKIADEDQQFFLGWATVTSVDGVPVEDLQGDIIDDETM